MRAEKKLTLDQAKRGGHIAVVDGMGFDDRARMTRMKRGAEINKTTGLRGAMNKQP